MFFFDRLYAVTNEFYLKRKDADAKTMGWLLVSLVQYLILLNIAIAYVIACGITLSKIINYKVAIMVMITVGIFNFLRYAKAERLLSIQKELATKSNKSKEMFNIAIIFTIVILIGLPIVYGVITNKT